METELDHTAPNGGTVQAISDVLANLAKTMRDLDDLVRLLGKGLSRAKPWQRQLASQLSELDLLLQVLRMTVVIERSQAEILAAADALCVVCRKTAVSVIGSRCDPDSKAAIRLISDLASSVRDDLRRIDLTHTQFLRQVL